MNLGRDNKSRFLLAMILALGCLATTTTRASAYSALYIFGDSLSDSGNNATVLSPPTPVPISGNDFIPNPYASGRRNEKGLSDPAERIQTNFIGRR